MTWCRIVGIGADLGVPADHHSDAVHHEQPGADVGERRDAEPRRPEAEAREERSEDRNVADPEPARQAVAEHRLIPVLEEQGLDDVPGKLLGLDLAQPLGVAPKVGEVRGELELTGATGASAPGGSTIPTDMSGRGPTSGFS